MFNNNIETLCPKCNRHPQIKIFPFTKPFISIDCYCGYSTQMNIDKYFSIIEKKSIKTGQYIQCDKHSQPYIVYCIDCSLHLCSQCNINFHQSHNKISILFDKSTVNENIKLSHEHIDNYLTNLLKEQVSMYEEEIEKLKIEFEKTKNRNNTILLMIEKIIGTYREDHPSYYTYKNIISNTNFSIEKYDSTYHYSVNDYFHSYSIINEMRQIFTVQESLRNIFVLPDKRIVSHYSENEREDGIKIYDPYKNFEPQMSFLTNLIVSMDFFDDRKAVVMYLDNIEIWMITKNKLQKFKLKNLTRKKEDTWETVYTLSSSKILIESSEIVYIIDILKQEIINSIRVNINNSNKNSKIVVLNKKSRFVIIFQTKVVIYNILGMQEGQFDIQVEMFENPNAIEIDDNRIIISVDCNLYLFNMKTKQIENTYRNRYYLSNLSSVVLRNGLILMSSSFYGLIYYDIVSNLYQTRAKFYEKIIKVDDRTLVMMSLNEFSIFIY